ncbi:hypothetical protein [Beijerinckia mobilis]|nr:hypothetical protein [Beijerinckia mobilis]
MASINPFVSVSIADRGAYFNRFELQRAGLIWNPYQAGHKLA